MVRAMTVASNGALSLVHRNWLSYKHSWRAHLSGVFQPLPYLAAVAWGTSKLVGHVEVGGNSLGYLYFVAPAFMATAAMNGASTDSTSGVYVRLTAARVYDSIAFTPLGVGGIYAGEVIWSGVAGSSYALGILCILAALGLATSAWLIVLLPILAIISFSYAAAGVWCGSLMRRPHDFTYVFLALQAAILLSGAFYPLTVYPVWLKYVVEYSPFYQGIALARDFASGAVGKIDAFHVLYMVLFGILCALGGRRSLLKKLRE